MPVPSTIKPRDAREKSSKTGGKLEILFGGPLLFVPGIERGSITDVEVFFPANGHPVGAVFLPETWFSAKELDDPECEGWPDAESFSMLDPHSYSIELTQKSGGKPIGTKGIPETNHKIRPGRRMSDAWELAIAVRGRLSGWSSHRHSQVTEDLYVGADAPAKGPIAAMHKLTYEGVTAAEFYGAGTHPRGYFSEHAGRGGSLIILGEVAYQPTLLHERRAIDALAALAGLDLQLADTAPQPHKARLMHHLVNCGHSIVMAPEG